ncbi:MAG: hypothetical protein GKS07_08315 [Nitrosopumilus sp.]|nr:MAG: hypothetical protein GKS07_08315 [Nitrosopumilus sp.]
MKLLLSSLLILSVLAVGIIEINEAYAGGAAYENRANNYWMQIYANTAIVIGMITAGSILLYKVLKGRLQFYKKTTDMRRTK